MKYPKINTLWKRDEKGNILEGEYSKEEFKIINNWVVQEKIDGQNWRIYVNYEPSEIEGNKIEFEGLIMQGRTKNSQFNEEVIERLKQSLDTEAIKETIKGDTKAVLYGELVGDKTQKNSWKYVRKEKGEPKNEFILFDAYINGWWISPLDIPELADDMKLYYAPFIYHRAEKQTIVELVKSGVSSQLAGNLGEIREIEGIVAKSSPLMLFRDGKPLVFKLKVSDY